MTLSKLPGFGVRAAALLLSSCCVVNVMAATPQTDVAVKATPRMANGRPDFNGNWTGMTGSLPQNFAVTHTADGSILARLTGGAATRPAAAGFPPGTGGLAAGQPAGVPPSAFATPSPAPYKPELVAKTQEMFKNGSEEDKVVRCGQPGLPRVGAPQHIVQTQAEMVILYADGSGMAWRVIPLDGRKHRDRVDPSYYGDSVGHWDGDTLVIDTVNLSEDTWMGEYGNFHSDQMHVIETLKRDGDKLTWQATVEDPQVLTKPWVKSPVVMNHTDQQIEEPAVCVPTTYKDPAGHHIQRF